MQEQKRTNKWERDIHSPYEGQRNITTAGGETKLVYGKHYDCSDKQAELFITKMHESDTMRSHVAANPTEGVVSLLSSVKVFQKENGEFDLRLDFLSPQKIRGQYSTRLVSGEEVPIYNEYSVSSSQLDAIYDTPEKKSELFETLAGYKKSGDMTMVYADDLSEPYSYKNCESNIFEIKPKNIDTFSASTYMRDASPVLNNEYTKMADDYKDSHPSIRIAWRVTKESLKKPVYVRDMTDDEIAEVGKNTGIYPEGEGSARAYTMGFKFTPQIALDELPVKEARSNPIANPYLVNYKGKFGINERMDSDGSTVRHDLLLDPKLYNELMKYSLVKDESYRLGDSGAEFWAQSGVTNMTVYHHAHSDTRFYNKDGTIGYVTTFGGLNTNEVLPEYCQPALSMDDLKKPLVAKYVRTINIGYPQPEGIKSVPDKPFDEAAHNKYKAISIDQVRKEQGKSKDAIKQAMNKGLSIPDKGDDSIDKSFGGN